MSGDQREHDRQDRDRLTRMEMGIENIIKTLGDDNSGLVYRINGHSRRLGLIEKFVATVTTVASITAFIGFLVRDLFVEWMKNRMSVGH